jgi:hypothetical protein
MKSLLITLLIVVSALWAHAAHAQTVDYRITAPYVLLHVPPSGTRYFMAVGPLTKEKCDQWRLASRDRDSKYILCVPLDHTGINDGPESSPLSTYNPTTMKSAVTMNMKEEE